MKNLPRWLRHSFVANLALVAGALQTLDATAADALPPPLDRTVDFERDVQPIFVRSCYTCHGPEKQKSSFRLDRRLSAFKGGDFGPAIIPHKSVESPLVRYVAGQEPGLEMPPEGPRLSTHEIRVLRRWIDDGAAWPKNAHDDEQAATHWWSWRELVRPVVPAVSLPSDSASHPIDAFVRAKLPSAGLHPSPAADRRTLIRRLYLDLHGLPPTPEEVDELVSQIPSSHHPVISSSKRDEEMMRSWDDEQAYLRLVDKLLASPRYGERWARHWLDTVHFADTHGFEHDLFRPHAWRYRDYVIARLNDDVPWDRFIREQLAAERFFPDEPALISALGFLGAGTYDHSAATTAPVTFVYLDRDDLVNQTMAAFVSTTANCARCHAHKFDPVSQEDYYALQAVFAGVAKGDVEFDADAATAHERLQWQALLAAARERKSDVLLSEENSILVEQWAAENRSLRRTVWTPLSVEILTSAEGSALTKEGDEITALGGERPDKDIYTITGSVGLADVTALRLDVLTDERLPLRGPGRQNNGNFHLSEIEVQVSQASESSGTKIKLARAAADWNQAGWEIDKSIDGNQQTAWGIYPQVGQSHHAVFEFADKVSLRPGAKLTVALKQMHGQGHLIGRFKLSATADLAAADVILDSLTETAIHLPPQERTAPQQLALAAHALRLHAEQQLARLPPRLTVFAAASKVQSQRGRIEMAEPPAVHVLKRGAFDKPGAVATPGALTELAPLEGRFQLPNPRDEGARRVALAEWLADRRNPLTWRSIANRVWHFHFGRGICDTPNDFGRMGATPSHPELLDWLAVTLRDDYQGSLKKLHRLIVTSQTYRQTSEPNAEGLRADSQNQLLWRMNRQRLDADAFRDGVLFVSGRLDGRMEGAGDEQFVTSKGPQLTPKVDYAAFDWASAAARRRSIYRVVWRGIPDPFLESLDFPDLGLLAPTRGFSASALQSLALYNHNFVLHHSTALAERVQQPNDTGEGQVRQLFRLTLQREPTSDELREFVAYAGRFGMPAACRVILNSNEFLFVD